MTCDSDSSVDSNVWDGNCDGDNSVFVVMAAMVVGGLSGGRDRSRGSSRIMVVLFKLDAKVILNFLKSIMKSIPFAKEWK